MTFNDLGLSPPLLEAIAASGYTTPTPIQEQAIPHALQGRDVLGIAQTGTGKTASFTLPMIEVLSRGRPKARMPRSLILTPTRELAAQIADNFEKYGKNHKLTMALLIGGVSFGDQDRLLMQGVDVLIATPGRLLDHFERGKLLLTGVQVMVVDEADRMLDMGFIPDIERIFKLTPFTRQTLFFSATMPAEIQRLTDQFLSNPVRIEVARRATAAETIDQFIVKTQGSDPKSKRAALRAAIDFADPQTAIVFCNRKRDVDIVARSLTRHGYGAAPIHGDLAQAVRTQTLESFKAGETKLLIASDVAARGLDIPEVSHVFNYDLPSHPEDYVHRIGRTGRAGRSGVAFSIATPADNKARAAIESLIQKQIPEKDFGVAEEADAPAKPAADASDDAPAEAKSSRRGSRRGGRRRGGAKSQEGARENAAPRENKAAREEKPAEKRNNSKRSGGRGKSGNEREHEVVGLGDHTPAFLLRPVPGET